MPPIERHEDYSFAVPKCFYGHIVMESRMRPEGRRIIGEGRSWHYDGDGALTKDTGWQPTGVVLMWPEPEPRAWWRFW